MGGDWRRVIGDGRRRGGRGRALAFLALAGVVCAAPVLAQTGRTTVIRRATPDSTRSDSIFMFRFNVEESDLMRLMGELMASRQVEERVARTLRESNDDARSRGLEEQLQMLARRNAMLASTIRLQCARDDMQPEGFMGVNFVGIEMRREGRGPTMYYFDSTRIVSVDPGSPAQRAGLEANDELVTIGGMDVSRPVPLGTVLKPGARLQVRVLRAGRPRDVTVVVGKRADDTNSPCATLDDGMLGSRAPQIAIITAAPPDMPRAPAGGGVTVMRPRSGDVTNIPAGASAGTFTSLPPFASASFNTFAGAQLVPLDADWRDMTGMDKGLLVVRVAPGSPAESVGLRKADVITAVGDSAVATTATFWRLMNRAPDDVTLRVMRARQPITVVFKVRDRQ